MSGCFNRITGQLEPFQIVVDRIVGKLKEAPLSVPAILDEFPEYTEDAIYMVIAYLHKKRKIKILFQRVHLK